MTAPVPEPEKIPDTPPEPDKPAPEPEKVPAPSVNPPSRVENDSQLKDTVNGLVDAVSGLVTTVTAIAESKTRDETPVKIDQ